MDSKLFDESKMREDEVIVSLDLPKCCVNKKYIRHLHCRSNVNVNNEVMIKEEPDGGQTITNVFIVQNDLIPHNSGHGDLPATH